MPDPVIPCPFVYANGKRCTGTIVRARAYGSTRGSRYLHRDNVRKYRLWCSEKDDHAGVVPTYESKQRMEFYPNMLPDGVEDQLWDSDLLR